MQLTQAATFAAYFQPNKVKLSEATHMQALINGDVPAFEQVFKTCFRNLLAYAYTIVKSESTAEEIVQNVFVKTWEKRESLPPETLLNAYLYRAVHNESLNLLKHHKVRAAYHMHAVSAADSYCENASAKVNMADLQQKLRKALNELPEQCRTIFQMSRFEEKKYKEIADELNISPKTVENQMGKALKLLRNKLAGYLPLLFILLFNLKN